MTSAIAPDHLTGLMTDTNENNGLMTKIWGAPSWTCFHSITFGYPINPTSQHQQAYLFFFMLIGYVLPCCYCRESYQRFILEPDTLLDINVMENRDTLCKWFYNIHRKVNDKLDVPYDVSWSDVETTYESFRAKCSHSKVGCVVPADHRKFSYKNLCCSEPPCFGLSDLMLLMPYVKLRGLCDPLHLALINSANSNIKLSSIWLDRNNACHLHIQYMRENSIPSLEPTGLWKGLPTKHELLLMLMLSTNLTKTEISQLPSILHQNRL